MKNQITQELRIKIQESKFKNQESETIPPTKAQGPSLKSQNANQEAGLKKQRTIAATSTMVQGSRTNDENHWE